MLFHVVYGLFCKRRLLFHVIYGCFRRFLARPLPPPPSRTHLAPGRAVLPRRPNIVFAPKSHANVGLAWISLDSGSNSPQFGLIHRNPVSFLAPVRHSFSDGGFPLSADTLFTAYVKDPPPGLPPVRSRASRPRCIIYSHLSVPSTPAARL